VCAAALLAALVACLGTPAPAGAAKVITVRHDSVLHLKGSDIYCTVLKQGASSSVACFHDPGGPTSSVRKGYAIAANDAYVAVEPSGSTRPVAHRLEPSLAAEPTFSGGTPHSTLVQLDLNDLAAVGGTHMAVVVASATGGGRAIGVLYLDGKDQPIVGTYSVGLSDSYVSIVRVTGPARSKLMYRHSVY
jgi:hypothetical protein